MTDKPPAVLERLWDDVPVHQVPVDIIVGRAQAMRRRRRAGLVSAGAAACIALTSAATTVPGLLNDESGDQLVADQATTGLGSHQVTVLSRLEGPSTYYFEGALVQVMLEPTEAPSNTETQHRSAPESVGQTTTWPDVTEGAWRLTASTRVCSGNCGESAPATDSCTLDLDVTEDTTVLVTYRWGRTCNAQVLHQDEVAVPAVVGLPPHEAATILQSSGLAVEVQSRQCPPTWDCVDGVFRTNPSQGTPVEPGTTVTLLVARE